MNSLSITCQHYSEELKKYSRKETMQPQTTTMDAFVAMKIVMIRLILHLDPENASRIMGYILIQEQGESKLIRLALGPDALLLSCINQAKAYLGISSNTPAPFFPPDSPRFLIPSNECPYSYTSSPPPFPGMVAAAPPFPRNSHISYGGSSSNTNMNGNSTESDPPGWCVYGGIELLNSAVRQHGQDQSSFLDGLSADASDPLTFPFGNQPQPRQFHWRSNSANDAAFLCHPEEGGVGCRPCTYNATGSCKNGSSCRFLHNDFVVGGGNEAAELGPPSANALQKQQRNDDFPSSQHIFLTFAPTSKFDEEDLSRYFSTFGPVNLIRIPSQRKRMYGFVVFQSLSSVELVLAKENPHYVCGCPVLVKPYKEKEKVPDKRLSPSALDSNESYHPQIGPRRPMDLSMVLKGALTHLERMYSLYQQPHNPYPPRFQAATYDGANPDALQEFDARQETSEADGENLLEARIQDRKYNKTQSKYNRGMNPRPSSRARTVLEETQGSSHYKVPSGMKAVWRVKGTQ